jgi:phenylacetic acid degradation operon negative regulatory protein
MKQCVIFPPMQPTARSLTLDLLSTLRSGSMPVRALVAAAELFGIEENSLRVSLARLYAAGSVDRDERGRYRLARTETPLKQQVLGWRGLERRIVDAWSGDWVAVIGAPQGRRSPARRSSRALELLGMRALRPGLHVRPDNLVGGVDALRTRYAGLCEPTRSESQSGGGEEMSPPVVARLADVVELDARRARALWNAERLERDYATLLETLYDSERRLDALPPAEAMVESFLVGGRVLRALNVDPLLPAPIVDVAARRALVEAMLRYDRAGRAKWSQFLAGFDAPYLKLDGDPLQGANVVNEAPHARPPGERIH